ncbi:MAG: kelch repeat-containing protein [bacterium]
MAGMIVSAWGDTPTWAVTAIVPQPREGYSIVATDDAVYVVGGYRWASAVSIGGYFHYDPSGVVGTVEAFDPSRNTWTERARLPTPRQMLAGCVLDGRIFAIGGYASGAEVSAAVESFEPASNAWSRKAALPSPRTVASAFGVGGKVYVVGGFKDGAATPEPAVAVYDPSADTWSAGSSLPGPGERYFFCAMAGKVYALGGRVPGSDSAQNQVYDPVGDSWAALSPLPRRLDGDAGGALGGWIMLIGNPREGGSLARDPVNAYDPATDTWADGGTLPVGGFYFGGAAFRGRLYVICMSTTLVEGSLPFLSKAVPAGRLAIRNNVLHAAGSATAQCLVQGDPAGGEVSFSVYSVSGLNLGTIGSVTLDAEGHGVLSFDGKVEGVSLRRGVYWIVARGAVGGRAKLVVAGE